MDNDNKAPVIPAGTEPTVFGNASFKGTGQAEVSPTVDKSENLAPQGQEAVSEAPLGTTFAELAAKKGFKSADDLAKAYSNLESQNKKVEMSYADLVNSRNFQQDDSKAESEPQTPEDALKIVERIVEKKTKPLKDQLEIIDLVRRNPDVEKYASQMAKLVQQNPSISWEVAYKAAKFDDLGKQSQEQGKQQAYQAIQQKQQATAGTEKATAKNEKSLDDMITDKNIPFSEVQKIMKQRFSQ